MASQVKGRTRRGGRLPQRVYWYRRSMVLVVAALLVFGIGKLLGGSGTDPAADSASTTASTPSSSAGATRAMGPVAPQKVRASAATTAPLLAPTGDCAADGVSVMPSVPKAEAGKPIVLHLTLEGTEPACSFAVSPDSLAVKITSGSDRIWSSQDCPRSVPRTTVVVRSGTPTDVPLTWSGRRSDDDCSNAAAWAMPGFYHVYAAALGSTPADLQFEVTYPTRGVVTRTAKPKPQPSASVSPRATPTVKPSIKTKQATPTKKPRPSPSASVKGKQSTCGGDNAVGSC